MVIYFQSSEIYNNPYVREVPCMSGHGFSTVDSAARLYGFLANGGTYNKVNLITPDSISKLHEPVVSGFDQVLQRNITYGRGTTLLKAPHVSLIMMY